MPQEVRYCDQCGRMVQAGDSATAIVNERVAVCGSCVAQLTPEQRAKVSAPPAQAAPNRALPSITPPPRRPTSGRRRAARATPPPTAARGSQGPGADQAPQGARTPVRRPVSRAARRAQSTDRSATPVQRNAVMLAVGAAALIAIIILFWALLGGGEKPAAARKPTPQSEYSRTISIQEKLRNLMEQGRSSTSDYEKARPALARFVNEHADREEARTAMRFIRQMDAEYEQLTGKSVLEVILPAPDDAPAPDAE